MAKGKQLSGKQTGSGPRVTERTAVSVLAEWCNEIIMQERLDLGAVAVETYFSEGTGYPDLIIYKSKRSKEVICVGEAKLPGVTVDAGLVKDDARLKATHEKAPYFVTTNFNSLWWYDTKKVNEIKDETKQLIHHYPLSPITDISRLRTMEFAEPTRRALSEFLIKLYEVSTGKAAVPKLSIDEYLVDKLRARVVDLAFKYEQVIRNRFYTDKDFARKLRLWFRHQAWNFSAQDQDFAVVARQTALLLVNKMFFYYALQTSRDELSPLVIPDGLRRGNQLETVLRMYFDDVVNQIDYETIYTTDFIDSLAFEHEVREIVDDAIYLSQMFQRGDFSKLGYDIVGRIFEHLIPQDERHKYGQYFTRSDIVDLILRFCMPQDEDALVLDPACGAGTFLIRAYRQKKMLNQRMSHQKILSTLWGVDIAKFPAHLATINLAISDLSVKDNYPRILEKNFFDEELIGKRWLSKSLRKVLVKTLGDNEEEAGFPMEFDAIVGNPPYTRQEEMGQQQGGADFKEQLIATALDKWNGASTPSISKRAGIHAYFFIHATKFLKQGGAFGFIVSNSWLDVEWGRGLQEFFLRHYRIIAILESKVERWFPEADVDTCIVILAKCEGADKGSERMANPARFVYLKKPLSHFVPPVGTLHGKKITGATWKEEKKRVDALDSFIQTISFHKKLYENDELRINPVSQQELWDAGYNKAKQTYAGSKWGKHLRAPDIYSTIMEKGKGKLVHLSDIAEVRRGFTTGANEFFYIQATEPPKTGRAPKGCSFVRNGLGWEGWIESKYLRPVLKSPRECKKIEIAEAALRYQVFLCHLERKRLAGTYALKYIRWGEKQGFQKNKTCASRGCWWSLPEEVGNTFWGKELRDRFAVFYSETPLLADCRLYTTNISSEIQAYLNSAISIFLDQASARSVGGGGGPRSVMVYEVQDLLVIDLAKLLDTEKLAASNALKKLATRDVKPIFEELGLPSAKEDFNSVDSSAIRLQGIKPDRRALDDVFFDVLGLTEDERLEVYKAIVDLVKARLARAASVPKNHKAKRRFNVEAAVKSILSQIDGETLGAFYANQVLKLKALKTQKLPKLETGVKVAGPNVFGNWELTTGKKKLECASEEEARYLKVWIEASAESVAVPEELYALKKILPRIEALTKEHTSLVEDEISGFGEKEQAAVRHRFWQEIIAVPSG